MSTPIKSKLGRPPNPGKWSRRHFFIADELHERLLRLGHGSHSVGLRVLVERYDKLRTKAKKRPRERGPRGAQAEGVGAGEYSGGA
jgi:hypothetical protein